MKKALQKKYALSEQGAKDLCKGILYSVLAYISLMLPVALLAVVLDALLAPLLGNRSKGVSVPLYIGIGVVILAVIFIMHYLQYTITYMRRVSAAELHLQKSFVSFRNMIFRI